MEQKPLVYFQEGIGGVRSHLLALGVVCADVGELPADVEQHVVEQLSWMDSYYISF